MVEPPIKVYADKYSTSLWIYINKWKILAKTKHNLINISSRQSTRSKQQS